MPFKYCYLIPVIQGILFPATFITTYILAAVVNKDVPAIFPYVSDTGAWSIERCIFSFMLGIGSLLMFALLYIRYRQVNEVLATHKDLKPSLKTINKITLYLASVTVLGILVLACFQVQPFLVAHLAGASTAFFLGWLVIVLQTYISFKIFPFLGHKGLNIFRAIIAVILTITLFLCGGFGALSLMYFEGDDITQWTENSGGYQFHLISVANEWILIFGVVLYLTLYTGEFKSVVLYKPDLKIINVVV